MSKDKKKYKCPDCDKEVTIAAGEKIPECCGKEMAEDLDQCTSAAHPEMARNVDDDDACDDGVH